MTAIADMPPQRLDDPRGLLSWDGLLPQPYQSAEDSTLENDVRYGSRHRAATPTERALLAHLGYEVPDQLETHVEMLSATIRRRTWLNLELPLSSPEGPM